MKPEKFKFGIKVMAKSVEYVPSYHASSSLCNFVISLLFLPVRRHLCTAITYQLQIFCKNLESGPLRYIFTTLLKNDYS